MTEPWRPPLTLEEELEGVLGTKRMIVYVGALLWAGLFLRDSRLRALVPFASR